ncbi:MAG: LapA family protein [Burkholderiaceae bacterium]|nr:LapA family protein [Burkholderiaceae bacterium]MCD8517982.1 LapA family protein [Burkholderiaceae bacterium]MCD8537125.1 LapA family protein [Burkholderiaceae bacterium]MCD8564856.1 LapA family protein [Burkholderiaceae bacterium]
MRYVMWALKLLVFAVVVLFAYKNMSPVDVQFLGNMQFVGVPLVVVMLVAFVLGTLLGVFLMLPSTWRRRREAGRLKRDLQKAQKASTVPSGEAVVTTTASTDASVKPL